MVATLYKPTQSVPITTDNCEVNCVPWQGILWSNSPSFIDDDCYLWLLLKKKQKYFVRVIWDTHNPLNILYIFVLQLTIQLLKEGSLGFLLPVYHICVCLSQVMTWISISICYHFFCWVGVPGFGVTHSYFFVDFNRIVNHHCLIFLFITSFCFDSLIN